MHYWFERFGVRDFVLFTIGDNRITVASLLVFLIAVLLLLTLSRLVQRWFIGRLLRRSHLERATQETIGTLLHYAILVIGFAVIMQNAGIDLSAFSVLAGAFGVGVGFGLQNIFSNVISGVIIMLERPVRIGDRIEIGGMEGDVVAIKARSTLLRTGRGALVIVPNQKFITEYVRNWESRADLTSLQIPVKVARGVDPLAAREEIAAALAGRSDIAADPPPQVYFTAADAAGYLYDVQVWLAGDPVHRAAVMSALLAAIQRRLAEKDVKPA